MIANWVFEGNVEPLMQMLSLLVSYDWDRLDHDALIAGLAESDGESDNWFSYALGEEPTLDVRLARDPGTAVIHVRIDAPDGLKECVAFAVTVAQEFELTSRLGR